MSRMLIINHLRKCLCHFFEFAPTIGQDLHRRLAQIKVCYLSRISVLITMIFDVPAHIYAGIGAFFILLLVSLLQRKCIFSSLKVWFFVLYIRSGTDRAYGVVSGQVVVR